MRNPIRARLLKEAAALLSMRDTSENKWLHERGIYEKWRARIGRGVTIYSYRTHPLAAKVVARCLASDGKPKMKECYRNAWNLALFDSRVKYVEGIAMADDASFQTDHAWNCIGDFHFDITAEIALKNRRPFSSYFRTLLLDQDTLRDYSSKSGTHGPYLGIHFNRKMFP